MVLYSLDLKVEPEQNKLKPDTTTDQSNLPTSLPHTQNSIHNSTNNYPTSVQHDSHMPPTQEALTPISHPKYSAPPLPGLHITLAELAVSLAPIHLPPLDPSSIPPTFKSEIYLPSISSNHSTSPVHTNHSTQPISPSSPTNNAISSTTFSTQLSTLEISNNNKDGSTSFVIDLNSTSCSGTKPVSSTIGPIIKSRAHEHSVASIPYQRR